jgi:SAM-dependent methyltransferase
LREQAETSLLSVQAPVSASVQCPICACDCQPASLFEPAALLRCRSCGFTFLPDRLDPDLYGDQYFDAYVGGAYLAHEAQRRHESSKRLEEIERFVSPPARMLEVGCAAGFFLDEARRRGYAADGIELNDTMAAHGRRQLGLDVHTGRIEDIELQPGSFDVACAFHVIEHLADPLESMVRIRSAVRPGGHIFVEVPNAESAAARRRGSKWKLLDLPHHVGHYGPRSLRALIERAELEVLQINTVPFAMYARCSPAMAAARGALEAARAYSPPSWRPHPSRHQLLRGVARRPAQ